MLRIGVYCLLAYYIIGDGGGGGAFLIFDFKQLFNTTLYVDFDFRFKIIKGEIQI